MPHKFPENLLRRLLFQPNGCIEFTGFRHPKKGYGQISVNGRVLGAHRASYEYVKGPIPDGLQIDHLCRNTSCVNPGHLEAVTSRENILRSDGVTAINARKTHCLRGHPLSGDNLSVWASGERVCRLCRKIRREARAA